MTITYGAIPPAPDHRALQSESSEGARWAAEIAAAYASGAVTGDLGARLPRIYTTKNSARSYAASVTSGRVKAWANHGPWQAEVRQVEDGYVVWVRRDSNMPGGA